MSTIETVRIRIGPGRIRVLRVIVHAGQLYFDRYETTEGAGTCRACGCTQAHACPPTCCWANTEQTLCSRCAAAVPHSGGQVSTDNP